MAKLIAPVVAADIEIDVHFPRAGIDLQWAFSKQMPRPIAEGVYARTTPWAVNVRGFEALTERARGGTRAGLSKWMEAALVEGWIVQHLNVLVYRDPDAIP